MSVSDAAARVEHALRALDGTDPLLVAIDGPSAAGKSTLAAALAERMGATVVAVDDFYRPMEATRRLSLDAQTGYELFFDWPRLMADVLDPLVLGEPAIYRCYDPAADAVGDDVVIVEPHGIVIIEGLYLLRPQLRGYWDLVVWVDTPPEIRRRRVGGRAGVDRDLRARLEASEAWYEANVDPAGVGALVVSGGSPPQPAG